MPLSKEGFFSTGEAERKATDHVIRIKYPNMTGWKCPWCPVEWTSITFTIHHMVTEHPGELAAA